MDPPQKPREQSLIRELLPEWRPTREQVLWAVRIMLVLFVLLGILTLVGLPFEVTLWDWLDLLIIPIVLALGGYLFTRSENRAARAVAERRAEDEALQAYLDQIGQLLLDKDRPLRQSKERDEVRTLARARTLTVLQRLDCERKGVIVRFLIESSLVQQERVEHEPTKERHVDRQPIISLSGASLRDTDLSGASLVGADLNSADLRDTDLSNVDLSNANLRNADLRGAHAVPHGTPKSINLSKADLEKADLRDADFKMANMFGARLHQADLRRADLIGADLTHALPVMADLRGARLQSANLTRARLTLADLTNAALHEANLHDARLHGADLSGVRGVTNEELYQQAAPLQGTTMPNGQKYEDWLKSNDSGEDGKNE